MDIGIVCQTASTGGWRYAVMLAAGLARSPSRPRVTVWTHAGRLHDEQAAWLERAGVRRGVLPGRLPRPAGAPKRRRILGWSRADAAIADLWHRMKVRRRQGYGRRLARILGGHDVVHFAWPYDLDPPPLDRPMSFIPHDFIYTHDFGVADYRPAVATATRQSHGRWLARAAPIVSSDFVAGELRRVFPGHGGPVDVVYLSNLSPPPAEPAPATIAEVRARHGLVRSYVLCPNNLMPHKNLGSLIAAVWHLRQAGCDVRLVACGSDTAGMRATVASPLYADRTESPTDWDLLGLGMVSDTDLVALMHGAEAVVNPSLCEAGSGSGLDAWACGRPVALADIPAFRDQVRFLGTHASWFDPRDPRDIARAIGAILADPAAWAALGAASRTALARHGWDDVAREYLAVFERITRR